MILPGRRTWNTKEKNATNKLQPNKQKHKPKPKEKKRKPNQTKPKNHQTKTKKQPQKTPEMSRNCWKLGKNTWEKNSDTTTKCSRLKSIKRSSIISTCAWWNHYAAVIIFPTKLLFTSLKGPSVTCSDDNWPGWFICSWWQQFTSLSLSKWGEVKGLQKFAWVTQIMQCRLWYKQLITVSANTLRNV